MTAFINHWNNNMMLEDAPDYVKTLFRKFTDEMSDKGNVDAMKAKAYACYGGNCIYSCDYNEAARLLELLWKDYGFGYAANTLGYIYYYGMTDNYKPDYERAFYYYSVASSFEIIEAKYKIADMFFTAILSNQTLHSHSTHTPDCTARPGDISGWRLFLRICGLRLKIRSLAVYCSESASKQIQNTARSQICGQQAHQHDASRLRQHNSGYD